MSDQPRAASPSPASTAPQTSGGAPGAKQPLPEAAVRALAEAAARRSKGARAGGDVEKQAANEVGGRGGLEPTRYGDWEVNGIASDF